jgi:hypothetical protein
MIYHMFYHVVGQTGNDIFIAFKAVNIGCQCGGAYHNVVTFKVTSIITTLIE